MEVLEQTVLQCLVLAAPTVEQAVDCLRVVTVYECASLRRFVWNPGREARPAELGLLTELALLVFRLRPSMRTVAVGDSG
jgi:hypothetical protein